jgi:hypothetical protein
VSTASVRLRRRTGSNKARRADSQSIPRPSRMPPIRSSVRFTGRTHPLHEQPLMPGETAALCHAYAAGVSDVVCDVVSNESHWTTAHRATRQSSRLSAPLACACRRSGAGARRATALGRRTRSMIGRSALLRMQTRSTKRPRPWPRPTRDCPGSARTSHPHSKVDDQLQSLRYRVGMMRRPATGESVE